MNIGSAASVHEALEPQKAVNRFLPGGVPVNRAMPIQPTMARVIAIQTPLARNSIITSSSIPAISIRFIRLR